RDALAAGRRRHLQALEDPRSRERGRDRASLRAPVEGGSRCGESAGQTSDRSADGRQRRPTAARSSATALGFVTELTFRYLTLADQTERHARGASEGIAAVMDSAKSGRRHGSSPWRRL